MQKVEISCDGCGADLTRTGNCVDYRLVLEAENIASCGGFVTAMGKYPAVDRAHHFCGLKCLDHWRGRENHKSKLWKEWDQKWSEEHGTDCGHGLKSYPIPPEEIRKERNADFEAQALVAFPLSRLPLSSVAHGALPSKPQEVEP